MTRTILSLLLIGACHGGEWTPMDVVATAYCPCTYCCGHRAVGITADGTNTRHEPYGIASDPNQLPYGTILWIPPGVGYLDRIRADDTARQFVVDDTGGMLRTNTRRTGIVHIDLRYKGHADAKRFGRKAVTIYVWKE
jgi:3D (Asp-Asp-Asp) domain-containing protein